MIQNKILKSFRDLVAGNITTESYTPKDEFGSLELVLKCDVIDRDGINAVDTQYLFSDDNYIYVYQLRNFAPSNPEDYKGYISRYDKNTLEFVSIVEITSTTSPSYNYSLDSWDATSDGKYLWLVLHRTDNIDDAIERINLETFEIDFIYYETIHNRNTGLPSRVQAINSGVLYVLYSRNTNPDSFVTKRYDFSTSDVSTPDTLFWTHNIGSNGIGERVFDVSERVSPVDNQTIEAKIRIFYFDLSNDYMRLVKKDFTGSFITLWTRTGLGAIGSVVDNLTMISDDEVFFTHTSSGINQTKWATYKKVGNDLDIGNLPSPGTFQQITQQKNYASQFKNLILLEQKDNADNINLVVFDYTTQTYQTYFLIQDTDTDQAYVFTYGLEFEGGNVSLYNYFFGGGVEFEFLTKHMIRLNQSIGNDTIDNLKITHHSLGIGDKPLNADDIRLENEIIRKPLLNKYIAKNTFTSQSNFKTTEANGYTIREIGVQSNNNSLVGRYKWYKFKNDKVEITVNNTLKHRGENKIETSYLQEEATKFWDGSGIPQNVEITNIKALKNGALVVDLPFTKDLSIDNKIKYIINYSSPTTLIIDELIAVNNQGEVLQKLKLNQDKTILENTNFQINLVLNVKEIGVI